MIVKFILVSKERRIVEVILNKKKWEDVMYHTDPSLGMKELMLRVLLIDTS